jgi:hypothetical protein
MLVLYFNHFIFIYFTWQLKKVCCKACFVGLRFTAIENNGKSFQLMFQQNQKTVLFIKKKLKTVVLTLERYSKATSLFCS